MSKNINKRVSIVERNTNETKITVKINLDGQGIGNIKTGLPFFDHMIEQLSKHSLIDIDLKCDGDLNIDSHHTVEDIGWALGDAVNKALEIKKVLNVIALVIYQWMSVLRGVALMFQEGRG